MKSHHLEEFYPSQLGGAMKCYFLEKELLYEGRVFSQIKHALCLRRNGECTFFVNVKKTDVESVRYYYTIWRCTKSGGY